VPTGERLLTASAYLALALVGLLAGTIEAFLVPLRLFGGVEGLVVLLAAIGNAAIGLLATFGLDHPSAPLAPGVGWFVAASYFTFVGHGGDVVVPGGLGNDPGVVWVGVLWYFLGVTGFAVALFASRFTARTRLEALHQAGERAEA
jgi:hypothetical protein